MKKDFQLLGVVLVLGIFAWDSLQSNEVDSPMAGMIRLFGPDRFFMEPPGSYGGQRHKAIYDAVKTESQMSLLDSLSKLDAAREKVLAETSALWSEAKSRTDLPTLLRLEAMRDRLDGSSLTKMDEAPDQSPEEKEIIGKWNSYMDTLEELLLKLRVTGVSTYGRRLTDLKDTLVSEESLQEAQIVNAEIERALNLSKSLRGSGVEPASPAEPVREPAVEIPKDLRNKGGHYYAYIKEGLSWDEARSACESLGGTLVILDSDSEVDWIRDWLREENTQAWIGLSRKTMQSEFVWLDGGELEAGLWAKNQPSNSEGELVAYMGIRGINDSEPAKKGIEGFICEWSNRPTRNR
ncbi:MAG: C-type lectin domain-containing protein [Verrucomicrobiota bacterium]